MVATGALQQLYTQMLFERRDPLADCGLTGVLSPGSGGKAAVLNNADKRAHGTQLIHMKNIYSFFEFLLFILPGSISLIQ